MTYCLTRVFPALALAMMLATAGAAMAQPPPKPGPNPQQQNQRFNLTQEQQTKLLQMHREYEKDTRDIVKQLHAKRIELEALSNNANADPKRISELSAQIADLTAQLNQKEMDLRENVEKEFGIPCYGSCYGPGYGPGRAFAPGFRHHDYRPGGMMMNNDGYYRHNRMHRNIGPFTYPVM